MFRYALRATSAAVWQQRLVSSTASKAAALRTSQAVDVNANDSKLVQSIGSLNNKAQEAMGFGTSERTVPTKGLVDKLDGPAWAAARGVESVKKNGGKNVGLAFKDGSSFRFHALWLRDACRDPEFVSPGAGERILSRTQAMLRNSASISAKTCLVEGDGDLKVEWSDGSSETWWSSYAGHFLRAHADVVARPLLPPSKIFAAPMDMSWLQPYTGTPAARAPKLESLRLWTNKVDEVPISHYQWKEARASGVHLEIMEELMHAGVVIIDGVPETDDADELHAFASGMFGGLQKDPARAQSNWGIAAKEDAQSISYAPHLRLNNHTHQSIPAHGIPALLLVVHYIAGHGQNTLVDGYAVAEALRARSPEAFAILTQYGNDQERDFIRSRVDAKADHHQSLLVSTQAPIIQVDPERGLVRLQYNEVFRTPSTLPYDAFLEWHAAYDKFVELIHREEFERDVPLGAGQILVVNNWRVPHGRAYGVQSPDRTLVGGTVVCEAVFSRTRQLLSEHLKTDVRGAQLLL